MLFWLKYFQFSFLNKKTQGIIVMKTQQFGLQGFLLLFSGILSTAAAYAHVNPETWI